MPRQVRLRPRARADLSDIWDHTVAQWSVAQAEAYLGGLDAVLTLIAAQPEIARLRPEFSPPVRLHPYRRHVIVYRAEDTAIEVVRILHARSNWAVLLGESGGADQAPIAFVRD